MFTSQTARNNYTGNGAVDTYAYGFKIFDDDDILVKVRSTTGAEATLTKTTHYTVTGVGESSGGNVALVNGAFDWLDGDGDLKTGYTLSIRRKLTIKQATDLRNQGSYFPEDIEDQLDKLAMIDMQQQDEVDRSVKLPETIQSSSFDPTLPADLLLNGVNKVPLLNAAGTGFADADEWPTGDEVANAQAYAQAASDSADEAAASETLAQEWATKTNGIVEATDFSAKAWAIGGTNVTDTASRGAAKEWAIETGSTVDTSEFSAKEYAQGTQAATGGSSKNWAQQTGADVTGAAANSRSAKSWAQDNNTGATLGGSAKDWAQHTGGTVDGTEYSAKKYAQDSAASALAASNSAAATIWRDVVFITVANSPYTIDNTHRGKLIAIDSSGGAIAINLPGISGLDLTSPYVVGFKKTSSDGNSITLSRNGTDLIDGATTKVISTPGAGSTLVPDTDTAPDSWTSADFGASTGNLVAQRFSGDGSTTGFTLSTAPGAEENTFVFIDGVYQQKDTYSVSGTTLTFSTAPPTGTSNIEVMIGALLSIGTPADGTVNNAKLTAGAVTPAKVTYIPPTVQRFTTSGAATYNKNYAFLIASGSATAGATYTNNGITYTVHKTVSSETLVYMTGNGAPASSGTLTKASGTGDSTLTFTEAVAAKYAIVEAAGGGGGGGGSSTTGGAGNNGTDTTIDSTTIIAGGGQGGAGGVAGGATGPAGGTVSVSSTFITIRADAGMRGGGAANNNNSGGSFRYTEGGLGGANAFGGAGANGASAAPGQNAVANTGGGGGGAGSGNSTNASSGAGGGAGAYVKALITSLANTYTLNVGAKGTGGGAGAGFAGGDGADGVIIFFEHYW